MGVRRVAQPAGRSSDTDPPVRGKRRGLEAGRSWKSVYRGVRVEKEARLTVRLRSRAALLLHPLDAHVSHSTTAELMGVPIASDAEIHVLVHRRRDRRYRPGLRPHYRAAPSDCVMIDGLPSSSPLQMFIELAGSRSMVDTVIAGDYLVRKGIVSLAELVDFCQGYRGKHSRKARQAAGYVREGVDSAMETRLRLLIVLAGLPEPTINHRVRDEHGNVLRRFELAYRQWGLVIEYDGRAHIERIEQWESDIDRREEVDENGWRMLIVTSRGIYRHPDRTVARIAHALSSRGAKLQPLRDDWRPHFPPR